MAIIVICALMNVTVYFLLKMTLEKHKKSINMLWDEIDDLYASAGTGNTKSSPKH